MMAELRAQAERFGAEVRDVDVTRVDFSQRPFVIETDSEVITANSVIVATGATAKRMEALGEDEMFGRGVSTCATCDGWSTADKNIAVVGGGDSALEEALFLTRFASHVTVVHRRDTLRASKVLQQRAYRQSEDRLPLEREGGRGVGGERVAGCGARYAHWRGAHPSRGRRLRRRRSPAEHGPGGRADRARCTRLHRQTGRHHHGHEHPGVFAAGDVRDRRYRQAITSAGDGCKAAMDAERWLEEEGIAVPDLASEIYSLPGV